MKKEKEKFTHIVFHFALPHSYLQKIHSNKLSSEGDFKWFGYDEFIRQFRSMSDSDLNKYVKITITDSYKKSEQKTIKGKTK